MCMQVLSKSVCDAFSYFDDPSTKETEKFIANFDRFFDCLNVRSASEWIRKRKSDLKPYSSPDDSRLKVKVKCIHLFIIPFSGLRQILWHI